MLRNIQHYESFRFLIFVFYNLKTFGTMFSSECAYFTLLTGKVLCDVWKQAETTLTSKIKNDDHCRLVRFDERFYATKVSGKCTITALICCRQKDEFDAPLGKSRWWK